MAFQRNQLWTSTLGRTGVTTTMQEGRVQSSDLRKHVGEQGGGGFRNSLTNDRDPTEESGASQTVAIVSRSSLLQC